MKHNVLISEMLCTMFLAGTVGFAGEKKPKRELTQEEMQGAYGVAVNWATNNLKAPATAQFEPIERIEFHAVGKNVTAVHMYVDSQNGFGAMLRMTFTCRSHPVRDSAGELVGYKGWWWQMFRE